VTFGLSLFVGIFAPWLLGLFGSSYQLEATTLLRWLALSAPISTLNFLFFSAFRVQKRLAALIALNLIAAAIFIGIVITFLGTRGINSIGFSWFISQSTILIIAILIYLKRQHIFFALISNFSG
jgi:O-antigen/teichoic acid export membrane protein